MGFDFNFDLEKIDKKEMLSYASIVGYLILGKIGYQRLFKDLTIIDKERSIINEKGKKVLRINRISPKMFFKFGVFWILYPIGLWWVLDFAGYQKPSYQPLIYADKFSHQEKMNPQFQEEYLFSTLKYFKVSEKLTKKAKQELKDILEKQEAELRKDKEPESKEEIQIKDK